MGNQTKKVFFTYGAMALFAFGGLAKADSLEAVFSIDVDNQGAFIGALDKLFESNDMRDHRVNLWATEFDGTDPASHVIVAEYEDYEAYETLSQRRRGSPDWLQYVLSSSGSASGTASLLVIQRMAFGKGWRDSNAVAAYIMTVTDPATYAAAFDRMFKAAGTPGSVRLMEVRAGGMGATHVALLNSTSFAALNEYIDELLASDAYRTFIEEVGAIRTINTVSMYRRVRTWGD